MSNTRVLIIGATSAIAQATARIYSARGATLCLVARDAEKLALVEKDLNVRGACQIQCETFSATESGPFADLVSRCFQVSNGFDVVLIAFGSLPNQSECEASPEALKTAIHENGLSVVMLATLIANALVIQGSGTLAVISSVAGDRGRKSNYVYGSAKSLVSTFLAGLGDRLANTGVHVLDIKPGFVDTPMTQNFKKGLLWAQPEAVAEDIVLAINKRRRVCYTPWFWRWIMLIIRHIPGFIFRKLPL